MKMPYHQSATVPKEKVTDYLLSPTHPRGSMKARWFNALGYSLNDPDKLIRALLNVAGLDVDSTEDTKYGIKYRIDGRIDGPDERTAEVTTVWIVLRGSTEPRLVTAYPGK